ncbi:hypothetical protein GWK47_019469 [Chionoecetes opilio]|uniref:Uncharacterized protein n=1 Tax=Chionoecetes opilio TaxID=41210 RepID=A0A8J5CIU4_CHIOP|nr:hypothetical protein GWK47_019469 [Chionoecetes opilio]
MGLILDGPNSKSQSGDGVTQATPQHSSLLRTISTVAEWGSTTVRHNKTRNPIPIYWDSIPQGLGKRDLIEMLFFISDCPPPPCPHFGNLHIHGKKRVCENISPVRYVSTQTTRLIRPKSWGVIISPKTSSTKSTDFPFSRDWDITFFPAPHPRKIMGRPQGENSVPFNTIYYHYTVELPDPTLCSSALVSSEGSPHLPN